MMLCVSEDTPQTLLSNASFLRGWEAGGVGWEIRTVVEGREGYCASF